GLAPRAPAALPRYTAPIVAASGSGPPITTSAAADPSLGPSDVGRPSASVGPVGISEASPRPRPPFLRDGCVMVVPSRMVVDRARPVPGLRRDSSSPHAN